MTNEQKELVRLTLIFEQQKLQRLAQGQWPEWMGKLNDDSLMPLNQRRMFTDWCLGRILKALLSALPKDLRAVAQACYDLRERMWSPEYSEAYYAAQRAASAQKTASSECLPASNSL